MVYSMNMIAESNEACELLDFLCLGLVTSSVQLQVSIKTSPPGPSYVAATLIGFDCVVEGGTEPIFYNWYSVCLQNGLSKLLQTQTGNQTLGTPILSTQTSCADAIICNATDSDGRSATDTARIVQVTGTVRKCAHCGSHLY